MSNYVRYRGETGRAPSPKIFGDMAKLQHDSYLGKCIFLWDDFAVNAVHATLQASGGYYTIQDTGVTVEGQSAVSDLVTNVITHCSFLPRLAGIALSPLSLLVHDFIRSLGHSHSSPTLGKFTCISKAYWLFV